MERLDSFGRPISKTTALKLSSEPWMLKKRGEQRLEVTQMKFLGHLLGIAKLDGERNQSVRDKLGVQNISREIQQYQQTWLQHLQEMDKCRVPKQAPQYQTRGRRSIEHPRKIWKDKMCLED